MQILLDMDEVLSDFIGGAAALWGVTTADIERHQPVGQWDIVPPLAKATDREDLDPHRFWLGIHVRGSAFWTGLDKLPWADQLLALVQGYVAQHATNVTIVTAPSHHAASYAGKFNWIKTHYPRYADGRLVMARHKYLLARPDAILIDDSDANVAAFIEHGGAGIVFPRHHNSQHAHKRDPVAYVAQQLELYRASNI